MILSVAENNVVGLQGRLPLRKMISQGLILLLIVSMKYLNTKRWEQIPLQPTGRAETAPAGSRLGEFVPGEGTLPNT